jgi:D-glycero-beta-D-manno-heptose-7-phosphate kinase
MVMELKDYVGKFEGKNILVVGDVMLDVFKKHTKRGDSPEGFHLDVLYEGENYFPGGAANVAANLRALGAEPYLLGAIGKDENGRILINELSKRGIATEYLVLSDRRPTTTKTRIVVNDKGNAQTAIRISNESTAALDGYEFDGMVGALSRVIQRSSCVLVSDYAKGVISGGKVLGEILKNKGTKDLIIDPKPANAVFYNYPDIVTPNLKEACELEGIEFRDGIDAATITAIGRGIRDKLDSNVVITRGSDGCSVFYKHGGVHHIPTVERNMYDVCGAGDTFITAFTLARVSGASIVNAAKIANHAAGIAVEKRGTSTVSLDELVASLDRQA